MRFVSLGAIIQGRRLIASAIALAFAASCTNSGGAGPADDPSAGETETGPSPLVEFEEQSSNLLEADDPCAVFWGGEIANSTQPMEVEVIVNEQETSGPICFTNFNYEARERIVVIVKVVPHSTNIESYDEFSRQSDIAMNGSLGQEGMAPTIDISAPWNENESSGILFQQNDIEFIADYVALIPGEYFHARVQVRYGDAQIAPDDCETIRDDFPAEPPCPFTAEAVATYLEEDYLPLLDQGLRQLNAD